MNSVRGKCNHGDDPFEKGTAPSTERSCLGYTNRPADRGEAQRGEELLMQPAGFRAISFASDGSIQPHLKVNLGRTTNYRWVVLTSAHRAKC
jgi:hypothetical protein